MAHSFVTAFPREIDAFLAYARAFPDSAVLLLDTYDTVAAARQAVEVARGLAADGHRLAGVRLDSGDLAALSRDGSRDPRRRGLPGCPDHRERRAGRARRRGAARRGSADRRVRGRDEARRLGRCALARDGLQAGELRRPRHAQGEPGKGDLGWREAGRPPARDGWAIGGRHAGARFRGRARGGGGAARAGDAGWTADRAAPGARDAASALRGSGRRAAGGGAAAAGAGAIFGGAERRAPGRQAAARAASNTSRGETASP